MGNKLAYPEVDLTGKVAIVTGGNTGIGYETAKALARMGAHTFIACRSKERAEAALERMKKELNPASESSAGKVQRKEVQDTEVEVENSEHEEEETAKNDVVSEEKIKVEFLPLDLSSFQSTTSFVTSFKERNLPLHILVNNAAISGVHYTLTGDGLESQLQVNHLGPLLLTLELMPVLLDTAASSGDVRIAFISSSGHSMSSAFNVEELNASEQNYQRLDTYCRTKLYNVMSAICLQRRIPGKNITVSSVHPGYVKTGLFKPYEDRKVLTFMHHIAVNTIGRKPVAGAATTINCVVNPELNSQQHFYYDSCKQKQSSADSRNEQFQEEMWAKSFEFLKDHLSQETVKNYGPKVEEVSVPADEVRSEEVSVPADEVGPVEQTPVEQAPEPRDPEKDNN